MNEKKSGNGNGKGLKIAKREGKYRGGQFKFKKDDPRLQLAFQFYREGKTVHEVSKLTGISTATFNRYKKMYGIKRSSNFLNTINQYSETENDLQPQKDLPSVKR